MRPWQKLWLLEKEKKARNTWKHGSSDESEFPHIFGPSFDKNLQA